MARGIIARGDPRQVVGFRHMVSLGAKGAGDLEKADAPGAIAQVFPHIDQKVDQKGGSQKLAGLGHGIGLEVHDPPRMGRAGTFQVGQVFTIEPGVYISTRLLDMLSDTPKNRAMIAKVRKAVERYQNIGVRIEDDYLITPNGVEWLSRAPREIAELEKLRLLSARTH